jgi:hypothetical protein
MQALIELSRCYPAGAALRLIQEPFQRGHKARRSRLAAQAGLQCVIFGRLTSMTHRELEFEALRATIRQRGTIRVILLPVTFGLWAGAAIATTAAVALPIAALVPLLVLAAGFEAIYALHVNVERVGRYLQVFHETDGGWEHVAMAFGQRFPARSPDPLFSALFLVATALNYLPVALGGTVPELIAAGLLHLLLAVHIGTARSRASHQRKLDLERFETIKNG